MRRPPFLYGLVCALAASGCALGIARAADAALAGAAASATGPLTPSARYAIPTTPDHIGRIIASVMVNGRGPFRFMVDTGANHTVLGAAILPLLGLTRDRARTMYVAGISGSTEAATARIRSLDTGALHLRNLQLPVLAGPVFADIDGILGSDVFEDRAITADFDQDRFTVAGSFGRPAIGDMTVPGRLVSGRLLEIDCRIGGVRATGIIDTGSTHTLGNLALLTALQRRHQTQVYALPGGIVDVTEASQSGVFEPAPALQFGTAAVHGFYMTFANFQVFRNWHLEDQPALLIGMDVLGIFSEITIDYRHRQFGLRPKPEELVLP